MTVQDEIDAMDARGLPDEFADDIQSLVARWRAGEFGPMDGHADHIERATAALIGPLLAGGMDHATADIWATAVAIEARRVILASRLAQYEAEELAHEREFGPSVLED